MHIPFDFVLSCYHMPRACPLQSIAAQTTQQTTNIKTGAAEIELPSRSRFINEVLFAALPIRPTDAAVRLAERNQQRRSLAAVARPFA